MKRRPGRTLALALIAALLGGSVFGWYYFSSDQVIVRAREVVWADDPSVAVAQLKAWSDQHPESAELAYLLAVAHRRNGKTALAGEELKRAAKLGWSPRETLRQQSLIDFQSGEADAEPRVLAILNEACPDETAREVYECLVKGYLGDSRIQEAERAINYWLQWRPDSVLAHLLHSEVLEAVKDKTELMKEYRKILQLDPKNRLARMRLAFLLLEHNDVTGAQAEFEQYLANWPENGVIRVGLANCKWQRGDVDEAEILFKEALKGDLPAAQRGFALAQLGQISLGRKSYAAAREYLEQAVEVSPATSATHYNLAMVLSHFGEKEAAEAHTEKSRTMTAQAERFDNLLDYIIVRPKDPALRCEAGEILLDQGFYKEANLWLFSALRCDNNYVRAHRALARSYWATGNADLARRHAALAERAAGAIPGSDTAFIHAGP